MTRVFNVYCDESCHLENDRQKAMVLGAVWCPLEKTRGIAVRIREMKVRHGLSPESEIKWVKVSPAKVQFDLDILDYFFDDDDLHFRALIVPDKSRLRHEDYQQTHDEWYYKMYFDMLKVILYPDARYRIYLDYKDTRGATKVAKLHEMLCNKLCNNMYDFSRQIIERLQIVRSNKERLPDPRRAERLPWCKPTIVNSNAPEVRVWSYKEAKGEIRTYLWLENWDYVIVLEERQLGGGRNVAFLITAFHVGGESTRRSLRRKHESRIR